MKQVNLTLTISTDGNSIGASHTFASSNDEAAALSLPNQGIYHIAYGMLLESVRRETYLLALEKLTQDPTFLLKYIDGTEDVKSTVEKALAENVEQVILKGVSRVSGEAAKGVLAMLAEQQ